MLSCQVTSVSSSINQITLSRPLQLSIIGTPLPIALAFVCPRGPRVINIASLLAVQLRVTIAMLRHVDTVLL